LAVATNKKAYRRLGKMGNTKEEKVVRCLPSGTQVECDDGVIRTVITREEAIAAGLNRYFTGIECVKGHMAERKVKGYSCTVCTRARARLRRNVRLVTDAEFRNKIAVKRQMRHKERYINDPVYKEKVLSRAKVRRQKANAIKKAAKEATLSA
jgi:hypothetical protein